MRAQLQSLPGSPAQAGRLAALYAEAADLKSKVAKMEAKAVPRPAPPQYAQVLQSVQHFLAGSGSMQRMQSLLVHLEVGSSYCMLHEFCRDVLPEQCLLLLSCAVFLTYSVLPFWFNCVTMHLLLPSCTSQCQY